MSSKGVTSVDKGAMQIEPLKHKLTKLKSGSVLITKEEREQVVKVGLLDAVESSSSELGLHSQLDHTGKLPESVMLHADLPEVLGCLGPAETRLQEYLVITCDCCGPLRQLMRVTSCGDHGLASDECWPKLCG